MMKPLIVRSAYRTPEHNRAVNGATRSPPALHTPHRQLQRRDRDP